MKLQLKFELILIYNNAAMDNLRTFYVHVFSNSSHLEWSQKVGLADINLKGDHPNLI